MSIIQWNCRGLRSNLEEVRHLISKFSPIAICLQELKISRKIIQPDEEPVLAPICSASLDINDHEYIPITGYKPYYIITTSFTIPFGGVAIYLNSKLPQKQIKLKTQLQAVAVNITLSGK